VYLETIIQHLQGLDKDSRRKAKARTKDPRLKAKTKDYKFVLKDNQGPRTRTTSLLYTPPRRILFKVVPFVNVMHVS